MNFYLRNKTQLYRPVIKRSSYPKVVYTTLFSTYYVFRHLKYRAILPRVLVASNVVSRMQLRERICSKIGL